MLCFYLVIVVQILLESFPVSSSGHVALIQKFPFLPLCDVEHFLSCEPLQHLLHGPTIVILSLFFFHRWKHFFSAAHFSVKKMVVLLLFIGCADAITMLFYFFFKRVGTGWFPASVGFLFTSLVLSSLLLLPSIRLFLRRPNNFYLPIVLGAVQGIALLPGISRFGTTFVAGRWLGLSPQQSFEYSFLIQWPLLVGAFCKSMRFFAQGSCPDIIFFLFTWQTALVLMVSCVGAYYALRFVQRLAYKQMLWIFSFYLIIPFVLSLL